MTQTQTEPALNKILLMGKLADPPKLRPTAAGPVCNLTIEVFSRIQAADGQWRSITEYAHVAVWGKLGEVLAGKPVGERLFVEGRLQTRSWDDTQTGERRTMSEVVAEAVRFLEERPAQPAPDRRRLDAEDVPF